MPSTRGTTSSREERPSIGELVGNLTEKMSSLIRSEIQLAKVELATKVKHAGIGIGLFVGAAVVGLYALGVFITAAILGLSNVLSPWLAALIVGVVLLVIAAVLGLVGKKQVSQGVPPTPERAQENVKLDVEAVKEGWNT